MTDMKNSNDDQEKNKRTPIFDNSTKNIIYSYTRDKSL